uniref:Uncharacterized protein n=1 Tax=Globodera rostochiensis TaxID=31243 RepID=A0A914I6A2_GLORO
MAADPGRQPSVRSSPKNEPASSRSPSVPTLVKLGLDPGEGQNWGKEEEEGSAESMGEAREKGGATAFGTFLPRTVLSPHSSDHQKVPDKQCLLSIRSTFPISQSASSRIHQSESANLRRLANQERTARARKFPPPEPNSTSAAIHLTSHCHLDLQSVL